MPDYKKRLGAFKSTWDNKRLLYMVRSPTYEEAQTIPEEWDGLADLLPCLGDQGDVGSCTGWAGKGASYLLSLLNDKRTVNLSAGSIYWHSREYLFPPLPESIEGSSPLAIMKLLTEKGAATEECAPTDTNSPLQLIECANWQDIAKDFKIDSYHAVPIDPASIKAALYGITYPQPYTMPDGSQGKCPIYIAVSVYPSFMEANTNGGIIPLPRPNEPLLGGHALLIRGWKKINGADFWIIVNSWGTDNGDKGIYYMPFAYPIEEAWMITDDAPSPGPEPPPEPGPTPTPSPCPFGLGLAKVFSLLPAVFGRKGRFYYMNKGG